ncbi:MAG: leucine-rich repeat protein [Clostridia bacterium]|nr:leucine-rich repeat protein [Clostridia bacterium]
MKKLLKRALSIFLAILMISGTAPLSGLVNMKFPEIKCVDKLISDISDFFGEIGLKATAVEYTSGNFTYTLSDGKAVITGFSNEMIEAIDIPMTIDGYAVYAIGSGAFKDNTSIIDISISSSIKKIDNNAFYGCINLKNIEFNSALETISYDTFRNCTALETVTFAEGTTVIGERMFYNCTSLKSVNIPNTVTVINGGAFRNCTSLENISIPDSVETIGYEAFKNCSAATSIVIGKGVNKIDTYAFIDCTSAKTLEVKGALKTISYDTFRNCTSLETVTFAEGTTVIGERMFYNCASLKSVNIPNTVTIINGGAFNGCIVLEKISVPGSVKTIGYESFKNCTKLNFVILNEGIEKIETNAFYSCIGITELTIPSTVTTINNNAFYECKGLENLIIKGKLSNVSYDTFRNCTALETVTFAEGTTVIGERMFYNCASLKSVNIPNTVTVINGGAFRDCTSLENISIPDSVETIGYEAFKNCSAATSIVIGKGVNKIDTYAFIDCTSAKTLEVKGALKTISYDTFRNCTALETVTFAEGTTVIGERMFYNCISLKSVNIPNSVTQINNGAFHSCILLEKITIPENVKTIGYEAFRNCSAMTSVDLKDGVKTIETNAFYGCSGITELVIPSTVTTVRNHAFYECTALKKLNIKGNLTEVSYDTFRNCTALETVTFSEGTTVIGERMFYNCTSLESVNLPNSVTTISAGAFYNCISLNNIIIPENVDTIGNEAFKNCSALGNLKFGNGVITIGYGAFSNCEGLLSVEIPSSVSTIKNSAFKNCVSLQTLKIGCVSEMEYDAFSDCSNLQTVIIGDGTTVIGTRAFKNCSSLKAAYIPNSILEIANDAFDNCSDELVIYFDDNDVVSSFVEDNYIIFSPNSYTDTIKQVYTVTYLGGVEEVPSSQTKEYNSTIKLSENIIQRPTTISFDSCGGSSVSPIETMCSLVSWNTKDDGTGTKYYPGQNYSANANVVLYAQWYGVTSDELPIPQREDYRFDGWFTAPQGGDAVNGDLEVYGDIILYAHWTNIKADEILGVYEGTYTATQGVTGLTFSVYRTEDLLSNDTLLQKYADVATWCSRDEDGNPQKKFEEEDIKKILSEFEGYYIALFNYYPISSNPGVEEGLYCTSVEYDESTSTYSFYGKKWIQHDTYEFVDLLNIKVEDGVFVGDVYGPTGFLGMSYGKVGDVSLNFGTELSGYRVDITNEVVSVYSLEKTTINAIVKDDNGLLADKNISINWKVEDKTVAQINGTSWKAETQSASAEIVGLEPGVTTVFAELSNGRIAECKVVVTEGSNGESEIKLYSNFANLSLRKNEKLKVRATLFVDNKVAPAQSGISVTINDGSILSLKDITYSATGATVEFIGKLEGSTIVTFSDKYTGSFISTQIVVIEDAIVFMANDVPIIHEEYKTNSYYAGLYVDNFNCERNNDGTSSMSMNIYNELYSYAAIDVYDGYGKYVRSYKVDKHESISSLYSTFASAIELVQTGIEGTIFTYKADHIAKENVFVDIVVPEGGYIVISNSLNSVGALVYNCVDIASHSVSTVAKILSTDPDSNEDFNDAFMENLEKILMSDVEITTKFCEEVTEKLITAGLEEISLSSFGTYSEVCINSIYYGLVEADIDIIDIIVDSGKKVGIGFAEEILLNFMGPYGKLIEAMFAANEYSDFFLQIVHLGRTFHSQELRICSALSDGSLISNGIRVVPNNKIDTKTVLRTFVINQGEEYNKISGEMENDKFKVFNIFLQYRNEEVQPTGSVTVMIPVPPEFDVSNCEILRMEDDGGLSKLETRIVGDYLVFETTHFSYYVLVERTVSISIRNPSTKTISYGDAIILHAEITDALPAGATIKWESSNSNFDMDISADGTTCKISPSSSGDTTFTVSIVDANENVISSDEQAMTSKAGFFDKIIAFFKKLFGLAKTIPQVFKNII